MLTIDLSAIQQNWLKLASLTRADVAGVVKANAYGLGAREVANSLFSVGCREFFLATFDEVMAARSYLPANTKIYLFGGLRSTDVNELHKQNITPVLCSAYDIEHWLRFKKKSGSGSSAALKINTGMTRFGLDEDELFRLTDEDIKAINPELLISHLSCADEMANVQNVKQLDRFARSLSHIKKIFPSVRASLANSSGIFLGEPWHFDLLRPGAALYGVNPTPAQRNPMIPVLKLELPVLQVRALRSEESIGYAASAHLSSGGRVAVVAGGYADGIHRVMGENREGILLGYRVKVLGRISMDTMMLDISNVPNSDDEIMRASVQIIGADMPLDNLMKSNQSLGYEVLTSLGSRYQRIYLPGAL